MNFPNSVIVLLSLTLNNTIVSRVNLLVFLLFCTEEPFVTHSENKMIKRVLRFEEDEIYIYINVINKVKNHIDADITFSTKNLSYKQRHAPNT